MWDGCRVIWSLLIGLFRSRATLEAENLVLRQQILVLRRTAPKRLSFNALDRLILVATENPIRDRIGVVKLDVKRALVATATGGQNGQNCDNDPYREVWH